ncbi:Putative sensor-like histidine kinase [Alloactinosynnema sp. L-07]|uniref:sensor histidine kinase n=1 Tax=Alloactinosynnema sp. L-07 TaxID=1653480 RepID=UPI00065F00A5|nr:nitrate- and nitrite sensing domain-containing protein [Alloactinosynnema sp. L-07]CRK57938.1 Putative sensor-like histidine kinase [Alloactinosynnema sp. L-07]
MQLNRSRGSGTIQSRLLIIALVPSVTIMIMGVGLSAFLAFQGLSTKSFADNVRAALDPSSRMIVAVQEERRLTTLLLTGTSTDTAALTGQRLETDAALKDLAATTERLAQDAPDELRTPLHALTVAANELPTKRGHIDHGMVDVQQAYDFYGELVEHVGAGVQGIARSATDAAVGFEQMISSELFRSVEAQARSHVLVELAMAKGIDQKNYHELAHQMGTYHELIETIVPRLTETERKQYTELKATPEWKALVAGDDAVMARGPGKHPVTFDVEAWEKANRSVSAGLIALYKSHSSYAADLGTERGGSMLATSLAAGLALLLVAVGAAVIALRLSRQLIRRLTRLRVETLDRAETKLPDVVARINRGEAVDVEAELPALDHGDDEIGQVARALDKAQHTAITATVREVETRQGIRTVFLNIAHRSQVMVRRQLQVLDKAERSEEDPDQLALLFELDHLATRSRRNAENLIILGGKKPGRQWRNPVPLGEIVRSAVAETKDYSRVNVGRLPDVALAGAAVADMIHLLAELVDNATTFAPPETQVELRGTVVGRGLVLEIEDQGSGIEEGKLAEINERLHNPPDFGVMALAGESRIGLFVVAQLANRHGVKVTLRESIYGGVQAIVMAPEGLLTRDSTVDTMGLPRITAHPAPMGNGRPPSLRKLIDQETTALPRREPRTPRAPYPAEDAPTTASQPERKHSMLTAFQQGTQRARAADPNTATDPQDR